MPKLLIADDDPSIRALFARALKDLAEVDTVGGGVDALAALDRQSYDCVLLDLHMPVVDGVRVLEALAKPGPNQNTPVYVVTADVSEEARLKAFRGRAVFHLTKPVSMPVLRSLIQSTLARRESKAAAKPRA